MGLRCQIPFYRFKGWFFKWTFLGIFWIIFQIKKLNLTVVSLNGWLITSLKERSKLTKCYYKISQKKNDDKKLLKKSSDWTKECLEVSINYNVNMTIKLQDSKSLAKQYWAILSWLLYNNIISARPSLQVNGKFVPNFCEKENLFINYSWINMYTNKKFN